MRLQHLRHYFSGRADRTSVASLLQVMLQQLAPRGVRHVARIRAAVGTEDRGRARQYLLLHVANRVHD